MKAKTVVEIDIYGTDEPMLPIGTVGELSDDDLFDYTFTFKDDTGEIISFGVYDSEVEVIEE